MRNRSAAMGHRLSILGFRWGRRRLSRMLGRLRRAKCLLVGSLFEIVYCGSLPEQCDSEGGFMLDI